MVFKDRQKDTPHYSGKGRNSALFGRDQGFQDQGWILPPQLGTGLT
jgi:hypothetical protein